MWGIEEPWELIAERMSVPSAYIDRDAQIRFINTAFARQFAGHPIPTVAQSLWDTIELPATLGDPLAAIRAGEALSFPSRVKSDGVPTRDVWVNCIPHRTADGRVSGCVVVLTDKHDADEAVRGTDEIRTIVDAADASRELLCEELHDNVGQQLTGLQMRVDGLAQLVVGFDPEIRAQVAKIAEGLAQTHANIRKLATGLIPADVPADGFVAEVDRFITQIREYCGRNCELLTTDPVRLADDVTATHLFRITQEAVCNAIRHGHSRTIRIAVRVEHAAVVLEVRDDGGGFSHGSDKSSLGIRLMHARAARIGGTLTIAARDGGTVVTVRIPAAGGGNPQAM